MIPGDRVKLNDQVRACVSGEVAIVIPRGARGRVYCRNNGSGEVVVMFDSYVYNDHLHGGPLLSLPINVLEFD